jgi:nitroimidazol reductase NimA-like FMN-containing flavoprotein (pyridoxamine 5'-phosphate oxidase superfamily)
VAELDERFSSPGAAAVPWADAERQLREADLCWLATVRRGGKPHVVPLLAVWLDGALSFITGEGEQKVSNLADNPQVTVTTGCNDLEQGLDVVVEGEASVVTDAARLDRLGDAYAAKYGEGWRVPGQEGVLTYEVTPSKVFGFGRKDGKVGPPAGKGEMFSQTRWRFS